MKHFTNELSSDVEEMELKNLSQKEVEKEIVPEEEEGKILWRIANALMTAFFIMASAVQFNDPDPFIWVPLYGTAALLTLCIAIWPTSSKDKRWSWIYWTHAGFCFAIFIYVIIELVKAITNPLSDGSINPLTYEEGREMAGVMITSTWLFVCKQSPTISFCENHRSKKSHQFPVTIVLFSLLPSILWSLCHFNILDCSLCNDFYVDKFSF